MGAAYNKGKSKQIVGTPPEFMEALQKRFGPIGFDVAATPENAKASRFFTEEDDALTRDWPKIQKWLYLNPPFGRMDLWSAKCAEQCAKGRRILMLCPYSGGTKWFAENVHEKAVVVPVGPKRITFVGEKDPYPKDLMVVAYHSGLSGYCRAWDYTKELKKAKNK